MKEDLLTQVLRIESAHPILNDEGFTLQVIYIVRIKFTSINNICQVLFISSQNAPFGRFTQY